MTPVSVLERPLAWEEFPKLYPECESALPGAALPWLRSARRAALGCFAEKGFPTERDEAWRFTPVGAISGGSFAMAIRPDRGAKPVPLAEFSAVKLVFVDGGFRPDLSGRSEMPSGVVVGSLAEKLRTEPERIKEYFNGTSDDGTFRALNSALFTDGAFVFVPKGFALDIPIHLLFSASAPTMVHWRNLVILESGAKAHIIEEYAGGAGFCNAATDIRVAEAAALEHVLLQRQAPESLFVSGLRVRQDRSSSFRGRNFSLGSALARADASVSLAGEGAECDLSGLLLARGGQHLDHHTVIEHLRPRGTSRELFKAVLDGRARAVFDGAINVRPEAQKTDARVYNKNLLLSEAALVNTKPVFQINANDVQCKHGAAIGQLAPEALFYLRSRGIGAADARRLLVQGFAAELFEGLAPAPLRDALEAYLSVWLDGGQG